MSLKFWKNASPLMKRVITIVIVFIFSLIITIVGILTPIEKQEAITSYNELNQTINSLKTNRVLLQFIFGNNFMISLIMLAPFVGPFFAGYAFYSTGTLIAATAIANDLPPTLGILALFLTPLVWLEFLAYSIAIAESVWLTRRIFQRRGKHELVNTSKFALICAVILLVSAVIEIALI